MLASQLCMIVRSFVRSFVGPDAAPIERSGRRANRKDGWISSLGTEMSKKSKDRLRDASL